MAKSVKSEGIVLKKKGLLNKDYLVTIFTKDQGKIKVFAKGIKKITSRRLSHIETSNLIQTILSTKNDRFYLQETKLISGFAKIKDDQKKVNYLYQFFFVLERLLPENQKELNIYQLTKKFLIKLSSDEFSQMDLTQFINQLMRQLGYSKKILSFNELKQTIEEIISEKLPSFII